MTPATDEYAHVRAAFRHVTLGLLEWQDPPMSLLDANLWLIETGQAEKARGSWKPAEELTPRQYRRLELVEEGYVYRPYDPQGEVEPYDVQADWEERS